MGYRSEHTDLPFTLGPIDLTLSPGELMFVVGGNGSGKTTLGKILVGLYSPEEGRILLDGQPPDPATYRSLFGVVFSDFYLFERLDAEGTPELQQRAAAYLDLFLLGHKVKLLGDKLSTVSLSQGQRKRLALLHVYLEDRPIYLFDEWAADQDPSFKEVFYLQILADLKRRGKTVIVITHDDRYFHLADRVVMLDFGRIRQTEGAAAQRSS